MRPQLLIVTGACALAFCVVVLGAYVRLSDAGLSCPDWPGCYGYPIVPSTDAAISAANKSFPGQPVHTSKAWKEMTHRYLAGALGLSIAVIAWRAWWRRRTEPPGALPFVLFTLVLLQALVGMWTVTLLLKPVVVTAHLLGGMATLALLWWMFLEEARSGSWHGAWPARYRPYRVLIAIAAVVLVAQLFIGGWTSANYAALVCQEFPRCQGEFWPPMRLAEGFTLWRDLGGGPAHGGSEVEVLVGIHMAHRLGALLVVIVVAGASVAVLMQRPHRSLGLAAVATIALVFMQVALGISIVITARPLEVASAHTAIAALLLLAVLTQWHELVRGDPLGADRLRRGTS